MIIREKIEKFEHLTLIKKASFSKYSSGRKIKEELDNVRTCFMVDRDRIIHSKSFRRLKHKTQVYIKTFGDHYRTRLTHTLEVSQVARTIGVGIGLNENLIEAIALGHDLGHVAFAHNGEEVLDSFLDEGFRHNEQSVRVVEKLENDGKGLNLTEEVIDGILHHSGLGESTTESKTLEGRIVRYSDKIAYLNHDIDDSVRAKVLKEEDLPKEYTNVLGTTYRERINTMVLDIVKHSSGINDIVMSQKIRDAMTGLRSFMFQRVYEEPNTKKEEEKIKNIIEPLYEHYLYHIEELPVYNQKMINSEEDKEQAVCDYIAGMTDHFAIEQYTEIFIPKFFMQK